MLRPRWSFVLGLALAALLLARGSALAYCRMTTGGNVPLGSGECNERGIPLEWETPCLTYAVDASGSQWMSFEQTEAAVDAGFFTWTQVQCEAGPTDVTFQPHAAASCKKAEHNFEGGNVNTVAFLDPWVDPTDGAGLPRRALALTVVWHDERTGKILDVDMLINDTGLLCPQRDPSCGGFDLQSIVAHESGHFLGIGHSPIEDATMYFISPEPGDTSFRSLAEDDIEALCAIYSAGSSDPVCSERDFEPEGGLELDCEDAVEPDPCDGLPEPCDDPIEPIEPIDPRPGMPGDCERGSESCGAGAAECDEQTDDCGEPVSAEVGAQSGGCSVASQGAAEGWLWLLLSLGLLFGRRGRGPRRV